LILTASLASYLLGLWPVLHKGGELSRVGIAIGTMLLLVAVALIVVSMDPFRDLEDAADSSDSPNRDAGGARSALRPERLSANEPNENPHDHSGEVAQTRASSSGSIEARPASQPGSQWASHGAAGTELATSRGEAGRRTEFRSAHFGTNPWSATQCVFAIQPDPADASLWWLENECGAPVSIIIASCEEDASRCSGSRGWKYHPGGMVLPNKARRSVTYAEQTQRGRTIRYLACVVTAPKGIELIDFRADPRSSSGWLERFAAARTDDECLARVERWSAAGKTSGASIETLLGQGLPGRMHEK